MEPIIFEFDQTDWQWEQIRLGRPTSSRFDSIITPKKFSPAAAQKDYLAELLAEWLLRQPLEWGSTAWQERGLEWEADARLWYAVNQGVPVREVGFVAAPDFSIGCSPDGLLADDGLLEIKNLGAKNHARAMIGDAPEYVGQVNGQLFITGRSYCDLLFYNPELPPILQRIEPDPAWQDAFRGALPPFLDRLRLLKERWAEHRVPRPIHDRQEFKDFEDSIRVLAMDPDFAL